MNNGKQITISQKQFRKIIKERIGEMFFGIYLMIGSVLPFYICYSDGIFNGGWRELPGWVVVIGTLLGFFTIVVLIPFEIFLIVDSLSELSDSEIEKENNDLP